MFPLLPQILLLIKVAMWLVKQINVLFKSGFFSFFPPSPILHVFLVVFFCEGCCYCTCIQSLQKGFGSYCAGLGEASKSRGWGGSREICSSQSDTFSLIFPCIWVTCVLFPMVPMCSEVLKPTVPPGCVPPMDGTIQACLLVAKLESVAGHIPAVMWNFLYQGLSWTGTSPAAWGLHLICI